MLNWQMRPYIANVKSSCINIVMKTNSITKFEMMVTPNYIPSLETKITSLPICMLGSVAFIRSINTKFF